jgi:hypothetical protein
MVPRRLSPIVLSGLLTTIGLGLASCEKVPLLAPAGTVITMVSTTNVLPINGATDVVAVLIENGSTGTGTGNNAATGSSGTPVHNGTLVSFTTSLGKIEPAEARTNNGRVTVKFTADGRSGTATVTAYSGAARQTLQVLIGGAAAERVLVTANPTSLPSTGGTSTVTARVEDASGNPLLGVPVAFTTTSGTLSPVSAVTNDAGLASVALTTNAAATVTATAGGKQGNAALTLRSASSLSLSIPAGSVTVGAPTTFTITPQSGVTGGGLSNVVVRFGDGASRNLGTITSATTVAHIYSSVGIHDVTVSSTDPDGQIVGASGSVAVVGFQITLTASPANTGPNAGINFTVGGIPAGVSISGVDWDFGDGTQHSKSTTQSTSTTYSYPNRGSFVAVVTVRPTYGPSRTASVPVTISGPF